jgi:hypothetical protein
MVKAAIAIVARGRIAEKAGEPEAEIAGIDRHHDLALIVDDVLEGCQRITSLARTGSSISPCSLPRVQRLKGMRT